MSATNATGNTKPLKVSEKRKSLKKRLLNTSVETPRAEVMQLIAELVDFYWNEENRSGHLVSGLYRRLNEIGCEDLAWELRHLSDQCTVWDITQQKSSTKSKQAISDAREAWQKKRSQFAESTLSGSEPTPLVDQQALSRRLNELEVENKHLRDRLSQCDEIYFSRLDKMLRDFSEKMNHGLYLRFRYELSVLKNGGIASSFTERQTVESESLGVDTAIYAGNPGNRRRTQF